MIITSLLDLDLYKLTVGEVIFTYFRNVKAKYRMTVRNGNKIDFWPHVQSYRLDPELKSLEDLSLTKSEAIYLRSLKLFSEEYIKFLMDKPMQGCYMTTAYQDSDGNCPVPQVSGEWCRAMLYEIFCLSISNELYAENYASRNDISWKAVEQTGRARLDKKIAALNLYKKSINSYSHHPLNITEFGTRRRLSKQWQGEVIRSLTQAKIINGTSNVYAAMYFDIPCKGTFGHEYTMGMQGVTRVQDSQVEAFKLWLSHWKGKLKIALDDTLGTDKFIRDFSRELAEQFDGLRHDSGDWQEWTNQRLTMYRRYDINAEKKTLFYSDGLNDYSIVQIHQYLHKFAIPAFGVGTFFTNDTFLPVPQVVMKIIECNGQPVAKLSNNPAKASCIDENYLAYVKHVAAKF